VGVGVGGRPESIKNFGGESRGKLLTRKTYLAQDIDQWRSCEHSN
jgi:hypothetical protein